MVNGRYLAHTITVVMAIICLTCEALLLSMTDNDFEWVRSATVAGWVMTGLIWSFPPWSAR